MKRLNGDDAEPMIFCIACKSYIPLAVARVRCWKEEHARTCTYIYGPFAVLVLVESRERAEERGGQNVLTPVEELALTLESAS
tara:strand:- start:99 stop:347 length:249 start_codon:yes stop_codon:yes gene_type:complete